MASGSDSFKDFVSSRQDNETPKGGPGWRHIENGVVEGSTSTNANEVNVRLDSSRHLVLASIDGFDPDWEFVNGDVVSVGYGEDSPTWTTLPAMSKVIRSGDDLAFWIENRITGKRQLARSTRELS